MPILDELIYVGTLGENNAENEIVDEKEDGFTQSKIKRTTNDIGIWSVPKAYMTEAQKDAVEAFDKAYGTVVSFDFVNPESGTIMRGRLKERLKWEFDPKFPNRWTLKPFTFVQVYSEWS